MKHLFLNIAFICAFPAMPAAAQLVVTDAESKTPSNEGPSEGPTTGPDSESMFPEVIIIPDAPEKSPETDSEAKSQAAADYSRLTPEAEREMRLAQLFDTLQSEPDESTASLIAEEVWAIWLDSGSETVNFILRRGTAAQKRGEQKLARRMYDHVTNLEPEYAEGWARSARLALEEEDLGRALVESSKALVYEPRHFYALWTMGNVFEKIGQQDEALAAYKAANMLYPELKAVKDRLAVLQDALDGDVL